jgi:hypothetical protein
MGEKTKFADVGIRAVAPLPSRCCGRCAHGRTITDSANLTKMIECRCGPPAVLLVGTPKGVIKRSEWPVLAPEEVGCDAFELAPNSKTVQDS